MSENSKIEWTDDTFNAWRGCTKVSPGCEHCYAEREDRRHLIEKVDHWGKGAPRLPASEATWKKPVDWNEQPWVCDACGKAHMIPSEICMTPDCACETKHRRRVFCASPADWLDEEVPIEWLARLLKLIFETPHLDWLLLTKRPGNWKDRVQGASLCFYDKPDDELVDWLNAWTVLGHPPSNVWIGTTVEDQARAEERIPQLLAIPAKVRFLSCEPLLSPVKLSGLFKKLHPHNGPAWEHNPENPWVPTIHWVICGGESGPDSRPMAPHWARSLREQCRTAGVAFFFKQWGEWAPDFALPDITAVMGKEHRYIEGQFIARVGKKAAGRLLDGIEHNAFPS